MFRKGAIFLVFACLTLSSFAGSKGNLDIKVIDNNGDALPGATITVTNESNATNRSGVTNEKGMAHMRQLNPATDYVITAVMSGFGTVKREGIRVSIDQTFNVDIKMTPNMSEELVVTGDRPVVDQSTQVTGEFLELGLIEALPTGRSYQSYLQLVTGVLPTNNDNPAAKGGLNYADREGVQGGSRDNFYYIDGINTTDNVNGEYGATFNSEIIAEQQVMTGGFDAEYEGAPGLISNVVTKTGNNSFSGSLNYYLQNKSLVGDLDEGVAGAAEYDTYDTAIVFSGPIIKDKLFFLASYQKKEIESQVDVVNSTTSRPAVDESDLLYIKGTWTPTQRDTLDLIYSEDPREISATDDPTIITTRAFGESLGGERISLNYSHLFGDQMILEVKASKLKSSKDRRPGAGEGSGPQNDVRYGDLADAQIGEDLERGGYDYIGGDKRNREGWNAKLTYFLDTANFGHHEFKFGMNYVENQNVVTDKYPSGGHYESAAVITGAQTLGDTYDLGIYTDTDLLRVVTSINQDYTHLIPVLDTNGDGMVDLAEVEASPLSTAGNPHGQFNANRTTEIASGSNDLQSEGMSFFLQDTIDIKNFHINLGARMEEFEHFSATGVSVHKFDYEIAPRIGVSYDVKGDGRQKVWGFYGRYYDPVRGNMTDFAGAWTGWERHEQAFVADEWVTYRVRGGADNIDALFSPTTKTPYTDETTLGYQVDFGNGMSVEVDYTHRKTGDILEDYDITPYGDPGAPGYYTDVASVGVYALPLDYFGYTYEELVANPSNYVLATLAGGKREYDGFDITFRKAMSNHWQMLASYTNGDAKGNTNSDSNADLQGDLPRLDPRVPGMFARQPGSIEHIFKLAGSYHFDNGLEVGGFYHWNSGLFYTNADYIYRRYVPRGWMDIDIQDASSGIAPGIIGAEQTSGYGVLDLRVAYKVNLQRINMEFFVDAFNSLDDQTAIAEEGRRDAGVPFGTGKQWELPRRFYLGARVSF